MPALTMDQIAAAVDRPHVKVMTPEWGGYVHIRPLSAPNFIEVEAMTSGKGGKVPLDFMTKIVSMALCDDDGKFLTITPAQYRALADKGKDAMERVTLKALEISGLTEEGVASAEKN